jgi:diacylglycerol kinase family enzyme
MKILLVCNNPNAGHSRAGKLLPEVEASFSERGIDFDLRPADCQEHAVILRQDVEVF